MQQPEFLPPYHGHLSLLSPTRTTWFSPTSPHSAQGNLSFLNIPYAFPEQAVVCARAGAEPLLC